MLKLLGGLLAVIVILFVLGIVGLINSSVDWKLRPTIRRAKREVKRLARQRCPKADVFSFGATKIDPRYLAIWITTKTDEERDGLRQDADFHRRIRDALSHAGYPEGAVPLVGFGLSPKKR